MKKFNKGDRVRRITYGNTDAGQKMLVGSEWTVVRQVRDMIEVEGFAKGQASSLVQYFTLVKAAPAAPQVGDSIMVTDVPSYWWIKTGMVGEITGHNSGTYAFNIKIGTQRCSLNADNFVVVPKQYLRDQAAFDRAKKAAFEARHSGPFYPITGRRADFIIMDDIAPTKKVNKQAPIKSVKVAPEAILQLLTDYVKGTLGIDAQVTKITSSFEKSFDLVLKAEA
ncbi:hypothetical protein NKI59_11685 [Mesorhizobium sp. M0598]|uniref:hypothetical protein n=1 Tax=Mesorhizobium sp. M0598 TaxID=2956968 RepID=UPI00333CC2CC